MWIFTEIADWFDTQKDEENRIVSDELQRWVDSAPPIYANSPWYQNVGVYTAASTLFAINKLATTVGGGFVDVLRLGDGVRQGGWGYAKDALRLLMVLGPLAHAARYSISLIPAVDAFSQTGNCGWVAAARLLRLTGTRPFAEIADLARAEGIGAAETGGIGAMNELLPALQALGATARAAPTAANMAELASLVARNPQAAIMFGVKYGGKGHVLIAVRALYGGLRIIDRAGGKIFRSLVELEQYYKGISEGVLSGGTVIVENTLVVKSLGLVPSLGNIISNVGSEGGPVRHRTSLDHAIVTTNETSHSVGDLGSHSLGNPDGILESPHPSERAAHERSSRVRSPLAPDGGRRRQRDPHRPVRHRVPLSANARSIYYALSTRTPHTYGEIMRLTHLDIEAVISGVQELVDRKLSKIVPLKHRAER